MPKQYLPDDGPWYKRFPTWAGVDDLVARLEGQLDPKPSREGAYSHDPLPLVDFLDGLEICLANAPGRRFLEVGSGVGSKLHLARWLGWDASGIEIHPQYVAVSRSVFPECPVVVADAFEFEDYGEYDVVYCYRPVIDQTEQDRMNRVISERMRAGALFFSAGGPYPDWLEPVGYQVWRV